MRVYVALVVLVIVVASLGIAAAAISESEAAQIFQRSGCANCHNGAVAPTFKETVKLFQEWAKKYPDIDTAVKVESKHFRAPAHAYNSYKELMEGMKAFTPSISAEDFKALYEFYKMVFEEAKKAKSGAGGAAAAPSISPEEAKKAFKPCESCHNGAVAPTFDQIVKMFQEWAKKYPSLDEAVKAESKHFRAPAHAYNSYKELMEGMKAFTPSIGSKDFELLYNFFEQVFQQAKGGAGTLATKTATQAPTTTITVEKTKAPMTTVAKPRPRMNVTTLPEVPTPNPSEESKSLYSNAALIGAALLIIAIIIAAIAFLRK